MKCKCIATIALVLTVLGALNWGLWGFFQFDLVAWIFHGNTSAISRVVYAIIGLAGVYSIKVLKCCCKKCNCACHDKGCSTGSCCSDKGKGGCK